MTRRTLAFLLPNLGGGGAERVTLTLAKAFAERGYDVDLVLMERSGELLDAVPAGVRIVDLKAKQMRSVVRPLVRYLRTRRPQALQISMWPLTIMGIIATRLSRAPLRLIVSDHAILSDHYPRRLHPIIRATMRIFYPMADARVTVSPGAARDLARLSGLPLALFEVIHNPIEFPAELPLSESAVAHWGKASKRILTVGQLKPEKNHELLIRSLAQLPTAIDAKLLIAGTGTLRPQLMALAEKEGVGRRVIFAGYVANPWPLYAAADLFVLPSREESFANVLVEALYAGLPIVSTSTIGATGLLDGGKWGRIVPSGDVDALATAMASELGERRDTRSCLERALELSGPGSADAYLSLLVPE